jgi:hypothetical protein
MRALALGALAAVGVCRRAWWYAHGDWAEVAAEADFMEIDLVAEPELRWVVAEALAAPLPDGWTCALVYHHAASGRSISEDPNDAIYARLAEQERARAEEARQRPPDVFDLLFWFVRRWDLAASLGALAWAVARSGGGWLPGRAAGQADAARPLLLLALAAFAWESELRWGLAAYALCVHPGGAVVCRRAQNWMRSVRAEQADVPRRGEHPFVKVL